MSFLSLVFSQTSLQGKFNVVNNINFNIVFTVTPSNIQNLNTYLQNVPLGTLVASISILNPNQGALLYGSLYYTSSNPVQFTTDTVFNPGNNIVGIITLNFAYLGSTPIFSNGVFGGALLTYTIPSPYVIITNTNPLTINPLSITTLPTITVYPNPNACFLKNTLILTPTGYKKVKNLKDGDDIIVSLSNIKKTDKIKKIISYKSNIKNLYCIPKNYMVNEDLYITGGHAIKVNNEYRHISCLCKDEKYKNIIKFKDTSKLITYYHIELYTWKDNSIIANGLEIEPYYFNSKLNDTMILWNCTNEKCKYKFIKNKK